MEGDKKKWAIFTIKDRAERKQKALFIRIGIAFLNKDGSFNIILDASPLDGKLHMREWRDEERPAVAVVPAQAEAF